MKLELIVTDGKTSLILEGRLLGEISYALNMGKRRLLPVKVKQDGENRVRAVFIGAEVEDEFEGGQGYIRIKRSWMVSKPGRWRLLFDYIPVSGLDRWIVPAVMYDRNERGEGKYPRGGVEKGWSFREDRIPVPSCSILHNDNNWQAVYTSPAGEVREISGVKTFMHEGKPAFEISVPYYEEPYTYTEKGIVMGGLTGRTGEYFNVRKTPFDYSRIFYIAAGEHKHTSQIYIELNRMALDQFNDNSDRPADWSKIGTLKLQHLLFLLIDNGAMTAVKQGRGNGLFQSFYEYTSGSFLCKSLEAAVIFARVAVETGCEAYRDIAEKIGDFFLQGALPNGLHRDCYSLKKGEWGGYMGVGTPPELARGVNARCNGEVMVNYLRLYTLLRAAGITKAEFLRVAENNAQFYIQNQLQGEEEGSFGRWWDADGRPVNTLGTNGAYIISLLVELEKLVGPGDYLDTALDKASRYYGALIDRDGFYADTLDADCVDKEAGCALLRAYLDLYERSHDNMHLEYAVKAAGFILSWMFTYNAAFSTQSMLGQRQFRTRGMTAVSVAHHHLDFYGLSIAYDLLRLWQATNDCVWKNDAVLMINACSQLIASGEDMLGRNGDYKGWQPEQINQTNWDYKTRFMGTKGRFHTCVAWTAVLTLGAMLDIRERYPEILDFSIDRINLLREQK